MGHSREKVVSGIIWRFLERCGAEGVTFIVSIILARILEPEDYSTIAIVSAFIVFLQVFIDSGMGSALVQKKDADSCDFSTVFYFNICVSVLMYVLLFCIAPVIAKVYERSELIPIIRVLGFSLIIYGIKNVQQAYVSKQLLFKKFFFSTLGGTIGAAVIGCWMAIKGYGVWALVAQNMFNLLVDTFILWLTVEWKPTREFSLRRLIGLIRYGWKLLVSSILDSLYVNVRQLLIGKKYQLADLAYYNKGSSFPELIILNINTAIESVIFPTFSSVQDNVSAVKGMMRRSIQVCSFVIFPMTVGLAACGDTLVNALLTEKWLPCVPYLQLYCIVYATYPINTINLDAIKGMGRSDIFLKLGMIKKLVYVAALLVTMWISPLAIAVGFAVTTIINMGINTLPNKRLVNYPLIEQLGDILPNMAASLLMGAIVFAIGHISMNLYGKLVLQLVTGIVCYVTIAAIQKNTSLFYIIGAIKEKVEGQNEGTK